MRTLILILAGAAALGAQPTISNIRTTLKTHSMVMLRFDISERAAHIRVRYGLTTAYEGAGSFPDSGIQHFTEYDDNDAGINATQIIVKVSGLKPNTTYNFCPQVAEDNATWSACVNHVETTEPIPPGPHPAPPQAPEMVDVDRPDTTGYTEVLASCSDIQTKINQAAEELHLHGTIISLPAGSDCAPITLTGPPSSRLLHYLPADVNTSSNSFHIEDHGFEDNAEVMLYSGWPPGGAGKDTQRSIRGLASGSRFYVQVMDADNFYLADEPDGAARTFALSDFTVDTGSNSLIVDTLLDVPMEVGTKVRVVSTGTLPEPLAPDTDYYVIQQSQSTHSFKLSLTSGGAEIDITTEGMGTHTVSDPGQWEGWFLPLPLPPYKIIIRTATPDSEFVPEGVRVTPEFAPKMAKIKTTAFDTIAVVTDPMAHNYRLEGLEITHAETASVDIQTTINPRRFFALVATTRDASNIIFDRCYFHGLGYPNRLQRGFASFHSSNSAIINSYIEHFDYWSPTRINMDLTRTSSTTVQIAAGEYQTGPAIRTLSSPLTFTLTGGSTGGTAYVYWTLSGQLTFNLPTGLTGSCDGACTVINSATPGWPVNGNGLVAVSAIGTFVISAGAITSGSTFDYITGAHVGPTLEGNSGLIAGSVPEKTALINNHISAAGLPIHYDDNVENYAPTGKHYYIYRNLFDTPNKHAYMHPEGDKRRYAQRQQLEWKSGKYIKVWGNIFQGEYVDTSPVAAALIIMPTSGERVGITDVDVGYNIFRWGSGAISVGGGRWEWGPAHYQPPPPFQRLKIHNNLIYGINQYVWRGYPLHYGQYMTVGAIDFRGQFEDAEITHNTVYDYRSPNNGLITLGGGASEGVSITNNIVWINRGRDKWDGISNRTVFMDKCSYKVPACTGDGMALIGTFINTPDVQGNILIAGWDDETATTPRAKTVITSGFTSSQADAYEQSELSSAIGWSPEDEKFCLGPQSVHKSGGAKPATDKTDRGVDCVRLMREIGVIRVDDVLNITSSGATIPFVAPDAGSSCIVAYGEGTDPAAWTGRSSANTANTYARSITLSDLSANTDYGYRVWCAGTYQSETRRFITKP
jgi:hypothetical protein